MAHYDLHEQEQLAKIKYFWKDYGKYIIGILVVLVFTYLASGVYNWQQKKVAAKTSVIYAKFATYFNQANESEAFQIAWQIIKDAPKTEYAPMSALLAAKLAVHNKNFNHAIKLLSWVKDNAKDTSFQSIAILRLASVYLDQVNFKQARELLLTKHDLAFDGLFYEARGDMYVAQGDLAKARDAYKEGLQKAANDPYSSQVLQMKLSVIGG